MAPLCKGSSRGAGEGLFGKHRICKNSFAVVRHKPTSCRNRNTPQSDVRLTAPLLKRGQPLREQTAARKKKNAPIFIPAGSFRHAHACHLPLGGRLIVTNCTAAEGKVCGFSVLELEFLFLLPLWQKAKNRTNL